MNIFTTTLSSASTITINGQDGVMALSVQASPSGGSFSFQGNLPFQGMTPNPLTLAQGQTVTLNAYSPASPIAGVTIEWVSGNVDIIIGF